MKMIDKIFSKGSEARDIFVVLLFAFIVWEICVFVFKPSILILPPPSAIFLAFISSPSLYLKHLGFTLAMTCIGFFIAVILGIFFAVIIVYSTFIERIVYTLLVVI